ncbi:MAG: hypothetical protein A2516_04720 [Alphaproteobacteria bacterium RIFOXYD12_FULL_60_8]|nr:MAG: hypothetical protein A2516_04720 [Alphaproteobacteria bacterium RIFOXYD12_FULL_60_8]
MNRLSHHAALIHTMVLAAMADGDINDEEVQVMSRIVSFLPIFADFDITRLDAKVQRCLDRLGQKNGLDAAIKDISDALPPRLRETAYALACDVVAASGEASQEELRLLEMLRHTLDVPRLTAAAIEKGAAARFRVL